MQKKHRYRLEELANFLGAELYGDPECLISSISPLDAAKAGEISFLENEHYRTHLSQTKASAVILRAQDGKDFMGNMLIVGDPYLAYAKLTGLFVETSLLNPGVIDKTAIIGAHCQIDASASVGAYCVLGDRVKIGAGAIIGANCAIGDDCALGAETRFYPHVTLYHKVSIGERVIVHSGVVIGADGFGFANDKGKWHKIYQLGGVVIGDDVEIGANTTIDRGAMRDTVIEDGVKLDNQVQIAHNVRIGAQTAIAGCSAVAGSTSIGKHCMIAGGVGINGHIDIADGVCVTAMTGVMRSISDPGGVYSSSIPAVPKKTWWRLIVRLMQLDELAKRLQQLEHKFHE